MYTHISLLSHILHNCLSLFLFLYLRIRKLKETIASGKWFDLRGSKKSPKSLMDMRACVYQPMRQRQMDGSSFIIDSKGNISHFRRAIFFFSGCDELNSNKLITEKKYILLIMIVKIIIINNRMVSRSCNEYSISFLSFSFFVGLFLSFAGIRSRAQLCVLLLIIIIYNLIHLMLLQSVM